MSDDLVKRSDAMQVALWFSTSELKYSRQFVKRRVMEIPTAEPKCSEWIKEKRVYGLSKPFCRKCGAVALSEMINLGSYKTCESNFCPNCGARMKRDKR